MLRIKHRYESNIVFTLHVSLSVWVSLRPCDRTFKVRDLMMSRHAARKQRHELHNSAATSKLEGPGVDSDGYTSHQLKYIEYTHSLN